VRALPYGESLYQSARALTYGQEITDDKSGRVVARITQWADEARWLDELHEAPLRPRVIETLKRLRRVAQEAAVASESISKLNRSAALGRAVGSLTELIDDVEHTCPYPERPIVKKIAEGWRDMLALAAGQAGQQAITKPPPTGGP